jgi:hypothetical protein
MATLGDKVMTSITIIVTATLTQLGLRWPTVVTVMNHLVGSDDPHAAGFKARQLLELGQGVTQPAALPVAEASGAARSDDPRLLHQGSDLRRTVTGQAFQQSDHPGLAHDGITLRPLQHRGNGLLSSSNRLQQLFASCSGGNSFQQRLLTLFGCSSRQCHHEKSFPYQRSTGRAIGTSDPALAHSTSPSHLPQYRRAFGDNQRCGLSVDAGTCQQALVRA